MPGTVSDVRHNAWYGVRCEAQCLARCQMLGTMPGMVSDVRHNAWHGVRCEAQCLALSDVRHIVWHCVYTVPNFRHIM